jgi:hypothetical protein
LNQLWLLQIDQISMPKLSFFIETPGPYFSIIRDRHTIGISFDESDEEGDEKKPAEISTILLEESSCMSRGTD